MRAIEVILTKISEFEVNFTKKHSAVEVNLTKNKRDWSNFNLNQRGRSKNLPKLNAVEVILTRSSAIEVNLTENQRCHFHKKISTAILPKCTPCFTMYIHCSPAKRRSPVREHSARLIKAINFFQTGRLSSSAWFSLRLRMLRFPEDVANRSRLRSRGTKTAFDQTRAARTNPSQQDRPINHPKKRVFRHRSRTPTPKAN